MVVNDTNIYQKIKSKSYRKKVLKKILQNEKMPYYHYNELLF